GDVLAGLMAALPSQLSAVDVPEHLWRIAVLAVYLHGLAGDLACKEKGPVSMLAGDVAGHLSSAFQRLFPSF
ncbi:MAG: hypothetical protein IPN90_02870, partial [Elusimicrobia bacterium]|nr:hypothetical protein [Elusimicrobiota bacterium]